MTTRRTDAEAAADVVAVVLHYRFMAPSYTTQLLKLLGVEFSALGAAQERLSDRGHKAWRPPGHEEDRQPRSRRRESRWTQEDGAELKCVGTDGHDPHWAPEESFPARSDRPGHRASLCPEGKSRYQKQRRVTAKVLDELKGIGLKVEVDPSSNLAGIGCAVCGEPINAGEVLHLNGHPVHDRCDR